MTDLAALLAEHSLLTHLEPSWLDQLARNARIEPFDVGPRVLCPGDPADTFYVLRSGRIALEVPSSRGGAIVLETLDAGEVLGISWMLPPYRVTFDARCVATCEVIAIDAVALRNACDAQPELGYALYKQLAGVVRERLQAARMRLLDLYGGSHG